MYLALAAAATILVVIFTISVGKLAGIYHRIIDTINEEH
jgi:ABC-type dipeptide/oligopeptide/nickel transport system permease subunit